MVGSQSRFGLAIVFSFPLKSSVFFNNINILKTYIRRRQGYLNESNDPVSACRNFVIADINGLTVGAFECACVFFPFYFVRNFYINRYCCLKSFTCFRFDFSSCVFF